MTMKKLNSLAESLNEEFQKDTKLNVSGVLSVEGAPALSQLQVHGMTLACTYALKDHELIKAVEEDASGVLSDDQINAAKGAATVMAMNNVYYRAVHFMEDPEFEKQPAKLRMTFIGKPGIDKLDFELYCLTVSAINGCSKCVSAHAHQLKKGGFSNESIQSAFRIASVMTALHQALFLAKKVG